MIRMPDAWRGGEPREIVWNQDAGTVSGNHSCVDTARPRGPQLREWIDNAIANGGVIPQMNGYWTVEDPWRVPQDFLLVLWLLLQPDFDPDAVPEALRVGDGVPFVEHPRPPGAVA